MRTDQDFLEREKRVLQGKEDLFYGSLRGGAQHERPNLFLLASPVYHPVGMPNPHFVVERGPNSQHIHRPNALEYNAYQQLQKNRRTEELQSQWNALPMAGQEDNLQNAASLFMDQRVNRAHQRTFGPTPLRSASAVVAEAGPVQETPALDEQVMRTLRARGLVLEGPEDGSPAGVGRMPTSFCGPERDRRVQSQEQERKNDRMRATAMFRQMIQGCSSSSHK